MYPSLISPGPHAPNFNIFLYAAFLLKACPEVKTSALDTAEKWEEVCRQTCIQAAFIRVAALWAEEVSKSKTPLLLLSVLSAM